MYSHDRWNGIVDALDKNRVTSVKVLSERLQVSPATIRRDLSALHELGRLRRVRGGAIQVRGNGAQTPSSGDLVGQGPFSETQIERREVKRAIGAKAVELCAPDDTMIIDGGSTTYMFARRLPNEPFRVMTTSLPILQHLLEKNEVRILTPGGEVFRAQNIILSPYDEGILRNFSASRIFIGAQAITRQGLMQSDPLLVQSERSLMERAEEVIVLADSSKFTSSAPLSACPLERIDRVITDSGVPPRAIAMLESAGVAVTIVDVSTNAEPDDSDDD